MPDFPINTLYEDEDRYTIYVLNSEFLQPKTSPFNQFVLLLY